LFESLSIESIWVIIYLCMEAMLGISLYSYPLLARMLRLSYYFLCLLFNKIGEKDRTGSAWKWGGWGREQASNSWIPLLQPPEYWDYKHVPPLPD
jgi:hypothetical protein